ncbi:hypothetical protein DY000_02060548 [Brassica cretica]|uniref:Uncharacterized protein n=1 Tax=Brassica cretica TaxID=69181 RepID=A0ABQ7AV68_BRACR|nr:hypothetical protein DY000_02060548 [Brassica cretica]
MDFVCSPNSKDGKPWSSDPLSVLRRRRSDTAEFMEGLCDMNLREETLGCPYGKTSKDRAKDGGDSNVCGGDIKIVSDNWKDRKLWIHLSVAAPPLGPPPAPRLWLASESAASEAKPSYSQTTHFAVPNGPLALSSVNQPVTTLTKPTAFPLLGAHGPFPPVTTVSAANAPTGPVYRKVWYNHLILPYYHLVRLKLTLEKSWDYDQHFHANRILDRKRKDNSFKTGKNNDNRSYDY